MELRGNEAPTRVRDNGVVWMEMRSQTEFGNEGKTEFGNEGKDEEGFVFAVGMRGTSTSCARPAGTGPVPAYRTRPVHREFSSRLKIQDVEVPDILKCAGAIVVTGVCSLDKSPTTAF
jgi:hypothetical protein